MSTELVSRHHGVTSPAILTWKHNFMKRNVRFFLRQHGVPGELPLELLPVLRVDQLHYALVDDVGLKGGYHFVFKAKTCIDNHPDCLDIVLSKSLKSLIHLRLTGNNSKIRVILNK